MFFLSSQYHSDLKLLVVLTNLQPILSQITADAGNMLHYFAHIPGAFIKFITHISVHGKRSKLDIFLLYLETFCFMPDLRLSQW
jgi:hypothetical protein